MRNFFPVGMNKLGKSIVTLTPIFFALAGAVLSVVLAMYMIQLCERRNKHTFLMEDLVSPCIFVFRDNLLVDATLPAQNILAGCPGNDLPALKIWLAQRFSDLPDLDSITKSGGKIELSGNPSTDSISMRLLAENTNDGALRITLINPDSEAAGIIVDALSQQAMEKELNLLRDITNTAPFLITHRDNDGRITWVNETYLNALNNDKIVWPLPDILAMEAGQEAREGARRIRLNKMTADHCYDCYDVIQKVGATTYALPAGPEAQAEQNLREFVQVLTSTFANLPIGLAIFDHERQLQFFNPAIISLTGLSASFLSARPSLNSVLDQLRELRMLPEPRDYRSWRKQISSLNYTPTAEDYTETWSLPGDRTYQITGKPHPGGTVAFLVEDITSEITLVRKCRAELNLGSQILNGLDQALIVFDTTGSVTMSNDAYTRLWGPAPARLSEAINIWRGDWSDAPGLQELERALSNREQHAELRGVLFGPRNVGVMCWTIAHLPAGNSMVGFTAVAQSDLPPNRADLSQHMMVRITNEGNSQKSADRATA